MNINPRGFTGETDIRKMIALSQSFLAENIHVVDLPYRFCSWAFDTPDNIRLWDNAQGRLLAWAVMQTPFWMIDYAYDPSIEGSLHPLILEWADNRAREILNTSNGHPTWFVSVFNSQAERLHDLEVTGFTSQENVGDDSWSKVFMECSALIPASDTLPAAGFTIHPLAGEGEVEAYVELHQTIFGTRNMTKEWRLRTLRCPEYLPDLDLVTVAPDGRLAAMCVGWLTRNAKGETMGQIEPLGVHPDFRNLGLGRVILLEGLRRLRFHAAEKIFVETDKYRNAALALYKSCGFRVIQDVLVFRKDYCTASNGGSSE